MIKFSKIEKKNRKDFRRMKEVLASLPEAYSVQETDKEIIVLRLFQSAGELFDTGFISNTLFNNQLFINKAREKCRLSIIFSKSDMKIQSVDYDFGSFLFSEKVNDDYRKFVVWQLKNDAGKDDYTYFFNPMQMFDTVKKVAFEKNLLGFRKHDHRVCFQTVLKQSAKELFDENVSITFVIYTKSTKKFAILFNNQKFHLIELEFDHVTETTPFLDFKSVYAGLERRMKGERITEVFEQ
jgi:hypothetical protein